MEKALTDLFKSINALKTLICNEASEYDIYDKLSEIEKLCIEHKQEICSTHERRVVARKGEKIIEDVSVKYLTLAVNTIIKDATETINQKTSIKQQRYENINTVCKYTFNTNDFNTERIIKLNIKPALDGLTGTPVILNINIPEDVYGQNCLSIPCIQ